MSALGNNSKTSLKHFIVELNNNVFTRGDEAEILALRHQLTVLRRKSPKRLAFSNFDRLVFAGLYRIAPRMCGRNIAPFKLANFPEN